MTPSFPFGVTLPFVILHLPTGTLLEAFCKASLEGKILATTRKEANSLALSDDRGWATPGNSSQLKKRTLLQFGTFAAAQQTMLKLAGCPHTRGKILRLNGISGNPSRSRWYHSIHLNLAEFEIVNQETGETFPVRVK